MKPREIDIKDMTEQDERLIKFKEANFQACGYDASPAFLLWIGAIIVCPPLLLAWFIFEWYQKLFREVKIFFTYLKLTIMRFNFGRLLFVFVFILAVLFILANVLK